ncbi:MAG: hypothetical protein AAGA06_10070 [Pseudomonadota bacterium]
MGEVLLFLLFVAGVFWMFRKPRKKSFYGQTLGENPRVKWERPAIVPSADTEVDASDTPEKMSLGKRLYGIVFLIFWLSIWTSGCFVALKARLAMSFGDEGYIFLTIWLALAIPAWFLAAWTLFRLLRGDQVEFSSDGDGDGDGDGGGGD